MNKEEIKQALEIIREPITVNCIDYHYFDNENYNKLISTYENCLWFVNNMEQIIEITNQLQERMSKAIEYIEKYDVFKEFSFPLMKRDEENQVKSSIEYEFDISIKKNLLEILKGEKGNL